MYPLYPAMLLQTGCVLRSRKYGIYQATPPSHPGCNVDTAVTVRNITLLAIFSKRLKSGIIKYDCSYAVDTVFTAIMVLLVIGIVVQCTTLEIQEFVRGWKLSK
jgi:hypothetical protein